MSAAISPATSQNYGVQRVCRIWGLPRSSFYHAIHRVAVVHPVRRGPVPPVAEDRLLTAIQADLAASPFHGEGHRKVWARLRYGLGLVVGRNRVLRLMHENQLLSPNRHPPRPANDHDGTILTTAPDRLWGTDASMVQTVADDVPGLRRARSLQRRGHWPLRLHPWQSLRRTRANQPGGQRTLPWDRG
jgi:putative transposase